jgi:hypothetical protein
LLSCIVVDPWTGIRDSGWIKNQDPHIPDPDSESLEKFLGLRIPKFFDADPGSGMEKFGSRIQDPESPSGSKKLLSCSFLGIVHHLTSPNPEMQSLHMS